MMLDLSSLSCSEEVSNTDYLIKAAHKLDHFALGASNLFCDDGVNTLRRECVVTVARWPAR
jgi:hypothetical protein